MDKVLLSIGITSYKRINELQRCINSITTKYADKIEVIVSEDCSPLKDQIEEAVRNLACNSIYSIHFHSNESNLGYDRNVAQLIALSSGKYIMLMSDDDMLEHGALDNLIEFIMSIGDEGVIYAPYVINSSGDVCRKHKALDEIFRGETSVCRYVYDSILFSGLIFRKSYLVNIDRERFINKNYIQVYMFCEMLLNYGGKYFNSVVVRAMGDGENAYGLSESSGGNELLANRKSIISILEFHKGLFEVIRMFDLDYSTAIFPNFERQYSLHAISGLSIARKDGMEYYRKYVCKLKELDIRLYPVVTVYDIMLRLFGSGLTNKILAPAKFLYQRIDK